MGLYATLDAPTRCPHCQRGVLDEAQFHLGTVADMPSYKLGDTIRFGGGQTFGPKVPSCVAVGHPEPCTFCKQPGVVSIIIENFAIQSVTHRSSYPYDPETVLIGVDRVGDDGVFRCGVWTDIEPLSKAPPEEPNQILNTEEETILSEPILAWLVIGWRQGAVKLRASRDTQGRCVAKWELGENRAFEHSSLPIPLKERLRAESLESVRLGMESRTLSLPSPPDARESLNVLVWSNPSDYLLARTIALGILAPDDWQFR